MAKNTSNPKSKSKKLATSQRSPKTASIKSTRQVVEPKPARRLPSVWQLSRSVFELIKANKKLFIGIIVVYGLLNLILAQGLASTSDINNLKNQLSQSLTGGLSSAASSLSSFVSLLSSSSNSAASTSTYQFFLGLITSLAIIWALRQVIAGASLRIRDAFYRGMYPFVPFILVLLVIGLQLLPLLIGAGIYSVVVHNGIAVMFVEKLVWGLLFAVLALVSLYLVSSSIFALYIVTLVDMSPVKALRSARKLVKHRRLQIIRKLLFLPLLLLAVAALIMLPVILWLTPIASWVFFALKMFALLVTHSYLYILYRELLNE